MTDNDQSLESRVASIERRNQRVEYDKAWETSKMRRGLIVGLTYLVVVAYLVIRHTPDPFLNALVPALGFFLSTLALRTVKARWITRLAEKSDR